MSFKVVRDGSNAVICYGPNTANYAPTVPAGCTLAVENDCPTMPAQPDPLGFIDWLWSNMSLALRKKASKEYPWLLAALASRRWDLVEDNLSDAKTNATLALTPTQWNALRTAALTTYKLPVTLPAAS